MFEDYTATEKEIGVRPTTKPKTEPMINPIHPPKPVIMPSPKNVEEELKKVFARYKRLKK